MIRGISISIARVISSLRSGRGPGRTKCLPIRAPFNIFLHKRTFPTGSISGAATSITTGPGGTRCFRIFWIRWGCRPITQCSCWSFQRGSILPQYLVSLQLYMAQTLSSLEIHLFGMPQLLLNGKPLDTIRRKNRALLYYLAAHDQPLTRENLLTFFWPDYERSAAQPILRTMIHDLRKQLGDRFHADGETIAFAPDTTIDVELFSAVLQSRGADSARLAETLKLYRGDFLEGFSLTDSSQFDDWAAAERDRYRQMCMRGFAELSHHRETSRDYPAALESMQRALTFNPYQEDLQRDLMRLSYLNGDRAGVIRQYESLRKLLDEEMGVPPMPETRNLYDALINDTFVAIPLESNAPTPQLASSESRLPFLGREAELETLKGYLDAGKLILLEGEPGIGKTRLAAELIASQSRVKQPSVILRGVAYELEQGLPYQPIIDALRTLL